jgi:hypothetical protein
MNSIYIIDSFNYKSTHEMFNAALLSVCNYISSNIQYYASSGSIKCLKSILNNDEIKNVKFKEIPVLKEISKYFVVFKYLLSTVINLFIVLMLDKKSIIIFNYNNVFSLKILNSLNILLRKRIVIICHGELELLNAYSDGLGLQAKLIRKILLNFFDNRGIFVSKYLIFIVLGDSILENIKKRLGDNMTGNFYSIDHPYIFKKNSSREIKKAPINFGTIGVVNRNKNIENIIHLADIFSDEIKKKKAIFSITGPMLVKRKYIFKTNLDMPDNNLKELSRVDYDKRLEGIDYFLFFYDYRTYNYTASGAVFDVINFEKPLIAMKNKYFESLFKKYGEFGILVNSIDEMTDLIRKIINNGFNPQYDFKTIKNRLSADKISKDLNSIIEVII